MPSATRVATATATAARRAGRRYVCPPFTALLASSGARPFSLACSSSAGNDAGGGGTTVSPPRVAERTPAAGQQRKRAPAGEAIASRPSPPAPSPRAARPVTPLRRFGCSAVGRGPAFRGECAVVSGTRVGGNSGGGGGGDGGSHRLASTHASGGGADGDENNRVFAAVKDGTETYLVAARKLEAGFVVFDRVGGSLSGKATRHSVQVGEGVHLEAESDLIFLNHSCDPNCQMEVVEPTSADEKSKPPPYLRVTARASGVRRNELLTIDYNAMEVDMSSPFNCGCGAANCRGRVSGFANLPPAAQKEYTLAAAASASSLASAASAAGVGGERPAGPPPLIGAAKAWSKKRNVPGAL